MTKVVWSFGGGNLSEAMLVRLGAMYLLSEKGSET